MPLIDSPEVRAYVAGKTKAFNKLVVGTSNPDLDAITAFETTTGGSMIGTSLNHPGKGGKWAQGTERTVGAISLLTNKIVIERHQDAKAIELTDVEDLGGFDVRFSTVTDQLAESAINNRNLGRLDLLKDSSAVNVFTGKPMFSHEHKIQLPGTNQYLTFDNLIVGDDAERPFWYVAGAGAFLRVEQEAYVMRVLGLDGPDAFYRDQCVAGWRSRHTDTAGTPYSIVASNEVFSPEALQRVLTRMAGFRDQYGMRLAPKATTILMPEYSDDAALASDLIEVDRLANGGGNKFYNKFKLVNY